MDDKLADLFDMPVETNKEKISTGGNFWDNLSEITGNVAEIYATAKQPPPPPPPPPQDNKLLLFAGFAVVVVVIVVAVVLTKK